MLLSRRRLTLLILCALSLTLFITVGIVSQRGSTPPGRHFLETDQLPRIEISLKPQAGTSDTNAHDGTFTQDGNAFHAAVSRTQGALKAELAGNAVFNERNVFVFRNRGESELLGRLFSRLVAEHLGLLSQDPFLARLDFGAGSEAIVEAVSPWDPLSLQRHGRSGGILVRGNERPMEPFWEIEAWRTLASPLPLEPTRDRLQALLTLMREETSDGFYAGVVREADVVSFAKWHAMKTLLGENPTRRGSVLLFWDSVRGRWEWVQDRLTFSTSDEFDGEIDLFFDEMTRKLLTVPEIALIRNAVLWELVKDDRLVDSWKDILGGFGWDDTSEAIPQVENAIRSRIAKLRDSLRDHTLQASLHPPRSGSGSTLVIEFQGKSDRFLTHISDPIERPLTYWVAPRKSLPVFRYVPRYAKRQDALKMEAIHAAAPVAVTPVAIRSELPVQVAPGLKRLLPHLSQQDLERIYRDIPRRGAPHSLFHWPDLDIASAAKPRFITIPRGERLLEEDLVIPRDTALIVEAGAHLILKPGVSIISDGRLDFRGSADAPIRVSAQDPLHPWGSLVIRGRRMDREPSRFEHVTIRDGSGTRDRGVTYSGALSVYDADAVLRHVRFLANPAEDALNSRYSETVIESCEFRDNNGDAIDLDFSTGSIRDGIFSGNANDAIDLSFSEVAIVSNTIEGSPDKGISVGEKSLPLIRGNRIRQNGIGIAVKDLSIARIEDCRFETNRTAISTYEKKIAFGDGEVVARNNIFIDNMANHAP